MTSGKRIDSGLIVRAIRIWSGLLLLIFVTCHLLNLSLGVISLEAMDAARPYLSGIWSSIFLATLLLVALVSHYFLGLWALFRRPTLRTNPQDLVQLFSGLIVVPLMATHVVGVASLKINEVPFNYAAATKFFWLGQPSLGLLQVVLLSVVWIHGCAGLFTWMRSREGMRNMLGWVYPVAVAIPVLALLGFAEAGRSVLVEANAGQQAVTQTDTTPPSATEASTQPAPAPAKKVPFELVQTVTKQIIWGSLGLALLTFLARALRLRLKPYQRVRLRRGNAALIETSSRLSLSDSFRQNNQPHAGLCEGRGRCGTCAVRVVLSEYPLPEPTVLEAQTLHRIGADNDTRLACQLMPSGGLLEVEPVYPADYSFKDKDFIEDAPSSGKTEVSA